MKSELYFLSLEVSHECLWPFLKLNPTTLQMIFYKTSCCCQSNMEILVRYKNNEKNVNTLAKFDS
jgi:hypothetical protein